MRLRYIKGIRETYILLTESDLVQNKSYWKKSMDDSYRHTEIEGEVWMPRYLYYNQLNMKF